MCVVCLCPVESRYQKWENNVMNSPSGSTSVLELLESDQKWNEMLSAFLRTHLSISNWTESPFMGQHYLSQKKEKAGIKEDIRTVVRCSVRNVGDFSRMLLESLTSFFPPVNDEANILDSEFAVSHKLRRNGNMKKS